ncbi:MAG: hypothetical protein HN576_05825 [Bacteriovoracaceae bacterium]|jgi:hypothetical protein|nr:hypothetical protein [Bacteriovoracaceae bacterium]
MKNLFVIASLLVSMNAIAQSVEDAEFLFEDRGEDVANAVEAAEIYGDLAAVSTEKGEKANLLYRQSEALYYVGTQAKSKDDQEKIHNNGVKVSEAAISLLEGQVDNADQKHTLTEALFFWGANKGKWGAARGVLSSLGAIGPLKKSMNKILALNEKVEKFGADRILGRLYAKIPKIGYGGSKKKSLKHLKKAFENTLIPGGTVSVHGTNNIYYAEILEETDNTAKACEVLKEFSVQDPETLLETRIPETTKEIEDAKTLMTKFKC